MKKVLALLLSAVMAAACFTTAFAGEELAPEGVYTVGAAEVFVGPDWGAARTTAEDTFTLAGSEEPVTMEPAEAQVLTGWVCTQAVYDTLIKQDAEGNYVGVLAESCEFTDDLTLVIKIKSGIKFHDGTDLTADDVLFTLERLAASSRYATNYACIDFENTKVIDDTTVEVKLSQTFAPLLSYLSHPSAGILSRAYFEAAGEEGIARAPMGTGAFVFTEWVSGDRFTATRNEEYWGEKPAYKNLVVRFIIEGTTRMIELETGGVDAVMDLTSSEMSALANFEIGNAMMYKLKGENICSLEFLDQCEPLKDIRVRKAIAAALDVPAITAVAYGNTREYTANILPPDCLYVTDMVGYEYDPELAKSLLAEAGYGDGLTLKSTIQAGTDDGKFMEIVQAQLAEVGITIDLETTDVMSHIQSCLAGLTEFSLSNSTCTVKDPDQELSNLKASSPFQITSKKDEVLDGLLAQGAAATDPAVRAQCYADVCQYVYENVLRIPVGVNILTYGVRDYVDCFPAEANGIIDVKLITFK